MAKKLRVLLVSPGKTPEVIFVEDNYHAFQRVVGGHFQRVFPWQDPVAVICNEDGKPLGLPPNRAIFKDEEHEQGDLTIRGNGRILDVLVGNFFIAGLDYPEVTSLSDELIEKYRQRFRYPEIFIPVPGKKTVIVERIPFSK